MPPAVLGAAAARYVVRQRLGGGGMGVVHLGTVTTPAGTRPVAIKQLRRKSNDETDPAADDRIVQEARLVFQLTHANICQVLDLAIGEHGTFIVMEYVDGCDLRTLFARCKDRGTALAVPAAIHIAAQVAKALDYAHRRRDADGRALWIVHGDVTPQNILISREGEIKLADFGIARALGGPDLSGPGNAMVAGTPGFVAPEARAVGADHRADIYSLGATLVVALGGSVASSRAVRIEREDLHPELRAIVARATAERPSDRFASAAELGQALSLHLAHKHPSFTVAELAALVAECVDDREDVDAGEHDIELVSMTTIARAADLGPATAEAGATRTVAPAPARRSWRTWSAAAAVLGLALVVSWVLPLGGRSSSDRAIEASQPSADAAPSAPAEPTAQASAPPSPSPARAELPAADATRAEKRAGQRARQPRSRPPDPEPRSNAATGELGFLTVNSEPWGAVIVDGRPFADHTPVYRAPIAAGTHKIKVVNPVTKAASAVRSVVIQSGKNHVVGFDLR